MRRRVKILVVLVSVLGILSDVWASEWFRLNPLDWEASFEFDGSRRSGDAGTSQDTQFEEGIRIRQSGYSLDPKIATFSLEIEPVWQQGDFHYPAPGRDDELDASFLNYSGSLSLLHGTPGPVGLTADASRSAGTTDFSLGSRSEFDTENRRVELNWKTSIFPSILSYSERFLDQTHRSGLSGTLSERDDVLRTLRYRGRSLKMNLSLEHSDFDDRIFNRDYEEEKARWSHIARWGKGSRLNSSLDYTDRKGFSAYEKLNIAESARLQHTKNLYSSYTLGHSTLSQRQETRRNSASLGLTHQLYQNLTTDFQLSGASMDFDLGEQDEYGTKLRFTYNKKIWRDGRLTAGIGGGRRIVDREAIGGLLDVTNESHTVDITRTLFLNERYIDTTSIIVKGGAGFPVFTEGTDYTVVSVDSNFTQIEILPAGLINVGDTVLVDYSYQSLPSLEYSTNTFNYRVSTDFGWISLFHRASRSDQNLISGTDEGFLTDRRDDTSGLQIRWTRPRTRTTFNVERRSFRSGDLDSKSFILRQSLIYTVSPTAVLNLSANETFTESNGRQIDTLTADMSMRWRPGPNLVVTPRVGILNREERGVSDERYFTAGVDLRWAVRKLSVTASLKHNEWSGTINNTDENRLMLTLIRRSR
jgi:hypothetical protein